MGSTRPSSPATDAEAPSVRRTGRRRNTGSLVKPAIRSGEACGLLLFS
jgi:hypothetical protein